MGACVGKKQSGGTTLEQARNENQPQLRMDMKKSDFDGRQSSRMNQDRSTLTRPEQAMQDYRQQERVEMQQVESVVHPFRSEPQQPIQSSGRNQLMAQPTPVQMEPQQPINEQEHLDYVNRSNPLNFAIVVN